MAVEHYIAMDTHSYSCEICVKTRANGPARRWAVPTAIPALREVIESIRRPRYLTFEEGPLASWLYRNLGPCVDRVVVCDPRKNALVCSSGDKDDPIDASRLADLFAGGFLKAVHHPQEQQREAFKQLVGLYHERVGHRVSEANKVIARLRRWGVVVRERDFKDRGARTELLKKLPAASEAACVRLGVELLLGAYDQAMVQQRRLHRELIRQARTREEVVRLTALPGISWVRASTFYAYVDTPWRFSGKSALWKYMGIGLERQSSGKGPVMLRVYRGGNRMLKSMILGAAESAIRQKSNPFAEQHRRWEEAGLSPRNARRNVARSLAAVAWGMWKNGGVYDPAQVGVAACQRVGTCVERSVMQSDR